MSALQKLEQDWQKWLKTNLVRGVPANKLAATLARKGWRDAAYELLAKSNAKITMPYLDVTRNHINLSDKKVSILFTCYDPFVVILDDFLSNGECDALIKDADNDFKTSRVVNAADGSFTEHKARTSQGHKFKRGETDTIKTIEARIAQLLHWPVNHGEGIQLLKYEDGGEYRPHYDYFNPAKESSRTVMQNSGQRMGTFLMYLSDVEAGGGTRLPKLNFEVRPKKGMALYFANTTLANEIDPSTLHAGLPVTEGVKYLATKWLREKPHVK